MLTTDDRKSVIAYRCEKAFGNLYEAKEVAKLGFWSLAGNRLYYAAFHMASALLLDKGMTARTHSGIIHLIGSQFIAKGLISKEYGRIFSRLFELRHSGGYDDMYNATEEEVFPYIEKTEAFLNEMKGLLTYCE